MPNIDQKNIKVFHISNNNSDDELKQFVMKNLGMLQGYLLVFDDISQDLREFLESKDIDYIKHKHLRLNAKYTKSELNATITKPKDFATTTQNISDTNKIITPTTFIQKVVRSGSYITSKGDIAIFNRVNSASKIIGDGNIFIFGKCEGDVECNGDFLVLTTITKGKILFQGEIITPNMLKYTINLIFREDGKLNIKNILEL